MSNVALYTIGLMNPAAGPARMAELARLGSEIFAASDHANGFLGRAEGVAQTAAMHVPGEDFGRWGLYALPLNLPNFEGHDPHIHIATLSLWRDAVTARDFIYGGLHRQALKMRHEWFLQGPWPGHVLWRIPSGIMPSWSDGTARLEALAREGERADGFTFGSLYSRV